MKIYGLFGIRPDGRAVRVGDWSTSVEWLQRRMAVEKAGRDELLRFNVVNPECISSEYRIMCLSEQPPEVGK